MAGLALMAAVAIELKGRREQPDKTRGEVAWSRAIIDNKTTTGDYRGKYSSQYLCILCSIRNSYNLLADKINNSSQV